MTVDKVTIEWLGKEAKEDGDETVARACSRALEGDEAALAVVEESLQNRVARAHRAHRSHGHS